VKHRQFDDLTRALAHAFARGRAARAPLDLGSKPSPSPGALPSREAATLRICVGASQHFASARATRPDVDQPSRREHNPPKSTQGDPSTHPLGRGNADLAPSKSPLVLTLTPREHEVAALVARGLKNREIAATLVLSERTVHTHVRSILGKLGVSSRAQIAVWSIRQGLTSSLGSRAAGPVTRPAQPT
jgi:DNA-binding NarL/FixJ family response regulator